MQNEMNNLYPILQTIWKYGSLILFWLFWCANWFLALWCIGALWFQHWITEPVGKISMIILFLLATVLLLIFSLKFKILLLFSLLITFFIMFLWFNQSPTGKRDWDPPFERMPSARFSPDEKSVTIENIRDFHYRTEDDYDIRYRTETYCFDEIVSMDYSITHWEENDLFGHIILSFKFKDGRYLALSPEARMERGKKYELLPGFFRQYELIYILAKEEDVFQLRTHHRKYEKEEVLLYPTKIKPETAAFILKDMLKRANRLMKEPEFYNGITYNCLSTLAPTVKKLGSNFCTGWRGTFNGISDRTAFKRGLLDCIKTGETFEEYKKRHSVNQYVEDQLDPPDYSLRIRPDLKK